MGNLAPYTDFLSIKSLETTFNLSFFFYLSSDDDCMILFGTYTVSVSLVQFHKKTSRSLRNAFSKPASNVTYFAMKMFLTSVLPSIFSVSHNSTHNASTRVFEGKIIFL